jgi:hypothetical protein
MGYTVNKFDLNYEGTLVPVAVHVVTDGEETNYIVSIAGYENFEIKKDATAHWQAETNAELSGELLQLVLNTYEQQ